MALPTSGLTFHVDASVVTDLWTVNTAGVFSAHSTDTGVVNYWDDVEHGANSAQYGGGGSATWQSADAKLPLPSIKFFTPSASLRLFTDAAGADVATSSFITASAFTMFLSIYIETSTLSAAQPYDDDGILVNRGTFLGINVKNVGTSCLVQCHNYDGTYDLIELPVRFNTPYLVMCRHDSGNLVASINGGAETSIASGNTTTITDGLVVGGNYAQSAIFQGRIGELAIYNVALSGTNLTDAIAYLMAKWVPSPVVVSPSYTQFPKSLRRS